MTTRERPILFSGEMVRAILDGTKTQTRRPVKVRGGLNFIGGGGEENDPACWGYFFDGPEHHGYMVLARGLNERHDHGRISIPSPFGAPGDRLWVRETWGYFGGDEYLYQHHRGSVGYRADHIPLDPVPGGRWRLSIHMPRWASRITLEVTGVRVERLGDITEEDARAEGVQPVPFCRAGRPDGMEHVESFEDTWRDIYGPESWRAHPWVWAVSFRRIEPARADVAA